MFFSVCQFEKRMKSLFVYVFTPPSYYQFIPISSVYCAFFPIDLLYSYRNTCTFLSLVFFYH
jgi:hypothetical protein